MKSFAKIIACSCLAISLSGCENMNRQDVGMVTGGILGGALGSQIGHGQGTTVAIIGGTLLGGALGGAIGRDMDETDRRQMQAALERNRTNQPATWTNPDTGASYQVTPVRTYTRKVPHKKPQYCREFQNTATINGEVQKIYGKACRQPDGSWKVVS
jgi:surface antigen